MNVSNRYRLIFLVLVALVIYFPAITNNINSVDDIHILKAYGINGHRTLQQILLPDNQFYFRPLIELTYYFDNFVWGLEPSLMHLDNVLLHVLNVIMVYLVAVRVSALSGGLTGLPLISALLFATHPVNTEAVSWIAGRTDPLAAFFILLSTLLMLKSCQHGKVRDFYLAFLVMALSLFAKETSVMLVFASILIIFFAKPGLCFNTTECKTVRRSMIILYGLFVSLIGGYVALRLYRKPIGSDNAFSMLFDKNHDLITLLSDLLSTVGFYVKKLFIPFPLNFAITTISTWYVVSGVLALLISIYFLKKRDIVYYFVIAGLLFIIPAVVVRLAGLNWTPVAERYLYIPSAFISIGVTGILIRAAHNAQQERLIYSILAVVLCFTAVFSFKRNIIWSDNLSLYQDTVNKSPYFGDIHNELGVALIKKGEWQTARKHFILAQQLSKRPLSREFAELNLLNCDLQGKSHYEKIDIIRHYVASHDSVQPDVLQMLRNIYHQILFTENDSKKNDNIRKEIIALNDRIFQDTRDPHCLYSNGQLMIALGNQRAALDYFRKTVMAAPSEAYYYEPAKKLIYRLEHR